MTNWWYAYFILLIIGCLLSFIVYLKAKKKLIAILYVAVTIWIIYWLINDPSMLFWPFNVTPLWCIFI